jgi:hypothetical protein
MKSGKFEASRSFNVASYKMRLKLNLSGVTCGSNPRRCSYDLRRAAMR